MSKLNRKVITVGFPQYLGLTVVIFWSLLHAAATRGAESVLFILIALGAILISIFTTRVLILEGSNFKVVLRYFQKKTFYSGKASDLLVLVPNRKSGISSLTLSYLGKCLIQQHHADWYSAAKAADEYGKDFGITVKSEDPEYKNIEELDERQQMAWHKSLPDLKVRGPEDVH